MSRSTGETVGVAVPRGAAITARGALVEGAAKEGGAAVGDCVLVAASADSSGVEVAPAVGSGFVGVCGTSLATDWQEQSTTASRTDSSTSRAAQRVA